jgi:hypothetical protein
MEEGMTLASWRRERLKQRTAMLRMRVRPTDLETLEEWGRELGLDKAMTFEYLMQSYREGRILIVPQQSMLAGLRDEVVKVAKRAATEAAEVLTTRLLYERGLISDPFVR